MLTRLPDVAPVYRSSIPKEARENVTERWEGKKLCADYLVGGEKVGERTFFDTGDPQDERAFKEGRKHGFEYDWHSPGVLAFASHFVDGLEHGTARQWSQEGRLIGTYTMDHGTGIDLWRQPRSELEDGSWYLGEVLYCRVGIPVGFCWRVNEDQETVWWERHAVEGREHGIYREWNLHGRLRRGYPQYFLNGQKVRKREYVRACQSDPTLPIFRIEDNDPARTFPPEVAKELGYRK